MKEREDRGIGLEREPPRHARRPRLPCRHRGLTCDDQQVVCEGLRAILSTAPQIEPREALVAAVERTAAGKTYVDPSVAGRLFAHVTQGTAGPSSPLLQDLTERERQVVALLGRGLSDTGIAGQLH
ncbi:MAG: hypothetical protein OEO84_14735, partial [Betaproteobacteria bacterium]|nr:hypothetical protein [Betaproteobacteria bacterium]